MVSERTVPLPGWRVTLVGLEREVAALAALIETLTPGEELPALRVQIEGAAGAVVGSTDDRQLWRIIPSAGSRTAEILGQIVATATALLRRALFVHAGAVAVQGAGWILAGASGAGKTSLTGVLTRAGAAYLSDEVALVDANAGEVAPFLLPMAVKPWTARAMGPPPEGVEVGRDGSTIFHLPEHRQGRPVPARHLVLLGGASRRPRLSAFSRAHALAWLGRQPSSLQSQDRLEDAFAGFSRLLRGLECHTLSARSPAAAADLLLRELGGF